MARLAIEFVALWFVIGEHASVFRREMYHLGRLEREGRRRA